MHMIKQLEERNSPTTIEICKWSDRMDLVAFSNCRGCVTLQRLSWTRAWNLDPPKEGVTVKDLAWRPDGKVLAIGYSNREVLLLNIENRGVLYKLLIDGDITCIFWTKQKTEVASSVADSDETVISEDHSVRCLPEIPPLTNAQDTLNSTSHFDLFYDQDELNLLIVGTQIGLLHISIFGQFPCSSINLGANNRAINVIFSDDTNRLVVTLIDEEKRVKIKVFNTETYKTNGPELLSMASKHGHLNSLLIYLFDTMGPLKETWETILMELDVKLSKYAAKVPAGTLASDFLDLLMFGITSDEMCEFLLQDLTEKGLKKFGQIVEMSYTNIQKLLLKHVTKAVQNMAYHLTELRGMARLEHRYKVLGLSEETVTRALGSAGALLAKVGEMHQIIANFSLNYKAFFRWLYLAILHLTEEAATATATEATKISQQEVAHVCEFVQNFDQIGHTRENRDVERSFVMERLGQYLRDEELTIPPKTAMETSVWEEFLQENKCIAQHLSIIHPYKNYSLIMQLNQFKSSLDDIFTGCKNSTHELSATVNCFQFDHQVFGAINLGANVTLIACSLAKLPSKEMCFLQLSFDAAEQVKLQGCRVHFSNNRVQDLKFYSMTILSVLLQRDDNAGILCQFPIKIVQDNFVDLNARQRVDKQLQNLTSINCDPNTCEMKHIEGMVCRKLAVSGSRRVALVLNDNGKKVRLFEMEADEDEDDEAEMTRSDCSMQEDK